MGELKEHTVTEAERVLNCTALHCTALDQTVLYCMLLYLQQQVLLSQREFTQQ